MNYFKRIFINDFGEISIEYKDEFKHDVKHSRLYMLNSFIKEQFDSLDEVKEFEEGLMEVISGDLEEDRFYGLTVNAVIKEDIVQLEDAINKNRPHQIFSHEDFLDTLSFYFEEYKKLMGIKEVPDLNMNYISKVQISRKIRWVESKKGFLPFAMSLELNYWKRDAREKVKNAYENIKKGQSEKEEFSTGYDNKKIKAVMDRNNSIITFYYYNEHLKIKEIQFSLETEKFMEDLETWWDILKRYS